MPGSRISRMCVRPPRRGDGTRTSCWQAWLRSASPQWCCWAGRWPRWSRSRQSMGRTLAAAAHPWAARTPCPGSRLHLQGTHTLRVSTCSVAGRGCWPGAIHAIERDAGVATCQDQRCGQHGQQQAGCHAASAVRQCRSALVCKVSARAETFEIFEGWQGRRKARADDRRPVGRRDPSPLSPEGR